MLEIRDLVHINAGLNGICLILILLGLRAIGQQKQRLHKRLMLSAALVSALFLISYLTYHFNSEPVRYSGQGFWKGVYLFVLIPHIILAAVQVPLILTTIYRGLRGQLEKHKKLARWTAAVWIYVSITGILVYGMLY